jgi:hypothetical protein
VPDFSPLHDVLRMDFNCMRQLDCEYGEGKRATDDAILYFVSKLNDFFKQFSVITPSPADIKSYCMIMNEITKKINTAEQAFYSKKYANDPQIETMVELSKLDSFKNIPTRMQYWAADSKYSAAIRNPDQHKFAVKHLAIWAKLSTSPLITGGFFADTTAKAADTKLETAADQANESTLF